MAAENQPNIYEKINNIEGQEQEMQDKLDAFLKEPGNHKKIREAVTTERLNSMDQDPKHTLKKAAIALMEFTYPGEETDFAGASYDQIDWFVDGQYNQNLPQKVKDR